MFGWSGWNSMRFLLKNLSHDCVVIGFPGDLEDPRCFSRFSGSGGQPRMPVFTPIIYPVGVSYGQAVRVLTQSGG